MAAGKTSHCGKPISIRTDLTNILPHPPNRTAMATLRSSFLGSIAEICIVSGDHKKTMDGLLRLGIGPFQVFDFTPATVTERYFRGEGGSFELKVCFAKHGDLTLCSRQAETV